MKILKILSIGVLVLSISCTPKVIVLNKIDYEPNNEIEQTPIKEHLELAVLWQQNAGEYQALCYQAFDVAKNKIEQYTSSYNGNKPLAIITDIDETVLDNSPYSAMLVLNDENFKSESWDEWGKKVSAKPIPGALQFFTYVNTKAVEIFYISNRNENQRTETVKNLKDLNFPNSDDAHVLLRTETSKKGKRRKTVTDNYEVILYIGDNLSDFHSEFDDKNTQNRNQEVTKRKDEFGTKFIVLPNPMYGDWESKGIYLGKRDLSEKEKNILRSINLKSYK